jgi:hypothetical protein
MGTLWYALFRGELCRIRRLKSGALVSEAWRNGTWQLGPDFAGVDFRGRVLPEDEAHEWIRSRFREKRLKEQSPGTA